MKLKSKFFVMLLFFAALFVVIMAAQESIVLGNLKVLFEREVVRKSKALDRILELQASGLKAFVTDYAIWTEMADFVKTTDRQWARENLSVGMRTFQADAVWVYDPGGTLVYSAADSKISKESPAIPLPRESMEAIFAKNGLAHFFLKTSQGLMEIRGSSIHLTPDTERKTPQRGYFLAGKYLDPAYLEDVSKLIGGNTRIITHFKKMPRDVFIPAKSTLLLFSALPGFDGNVAAYLKCEILLPLGVAFSDTIRKVFLTFLIYIILFFIMSAYSIVHWVVLPLRDIEIALAMGDVRRIAHFKNRKNEFGQISLLMDAFFKQKDQYEKEISQRLIAEAAARSHESLLQSILESTRDGIFVVDTSGVVTHYNSRFLQMWSIPQDVAASKESGRLYEMIRGQLKNPEEFFSRAQALYRSNGEYSDSVEFIDGRVYERTSYPLVKSGAICGRVWSFHDVTARARTENALRESEDRYRTIVANIPGAVYRCANDPVWTMQVVSDVIFKISGYSASDFINCAVRTWPSIIHPDDRKMVNEEVTVGHELFEIEYRIIHADGSIRWVHERGQGMKDSRGKVVFIDGLIFDITDRKRAEEALWESQRRLSDIIDFLPDATFVIDRYGKVIAWNRAIEVMTEVKASDILGKDNYEYALPFYGQRRPLLVDFALHYDPEIEKEYKNVHRAGSIVVADTCIHGFRGRETYLFGTASTLRDSKGEVVGAIESIRDITDRTMTEEALRLSEEKFSKAFMASPNAIEILTLPGDTFVEVNDSAVALLGYTRDDLVGKTSAELQLWCNPEDRLLLVERLKKEGMVRDFEAAQRKRNNEVIYVSICADIVVIDAQQCVLAIVRDITERRKAVEYLKEAKAHADAASKAKSEFLANISHEIRTPLNAVIGFSELLKESLTNDTQRGYVGIITESSQLLMDLINDVLDVSKIEAGRIVLEHADFNLYYLIESLLKLMGPRLESKGLALAYDYDRDVPADFSADPTRIRQILLNLISNAIKFTEQGKISISVTSQPRAAADNVCRVKISVSDTGIGIPLEKQARIFDAFTQADASMTKKYGGTGLGLYIVKMLLEKMGGTISVQSEDGNGSTFTIVLPLQEASSCFDEATRAAISCLKDKKIVIIGSDSRVRSMLERYAKETGMCIAHMSGDSYDALEWLLQQSSLPDIVLCDVVVEGINGYQFASCIRSQEKLKAITLLACSNSGIPGEAARVNACGFNGYLTKPIHRKDFIEAMRAFCGEKSRAGLHVAKHVTNESELQGLRVLIVEDNVTNSKLMQMILERSGCYVDVAANGQEAIDKTRQNHYAVVLMDLQMPVVDGITATRAIRQTVSTTLPIIGLSAAATKEDEANALHAGMNDYITKPVLADLLRTCVLKWSMKT